MWQVTARLETPQFRKIKWKIISILYHPGKLKTPNKEESLFVNTSSFSTTLFIIQLHGWCCYFVAISIINICSFWKFHKEEQMYSMTCKSMKQGGRFLRIWSTNNPIPLLKNGYSWKRLKKSCGFFMIIWKIKYSVKYSSSLRKSVIEKVSLIIQNSILLDSVLKMPWFL